MQLIPNSEPFVCPRTQEEARRGHPRVYLETDVENIATCPYCGKQYRHIQDLDPA